jgi:DNA-binding transcriptional ArsR family regulator
MAVKSRTLADTMEDTKDRHRRYMRAIQHPVRRDILRAMERGLATPDELSKELGIEAKVLDWHLRTLEHGFCVERQGEGDSLRFTLANEGKIVGYLDRKDKRKPVD